MNLSIVIVSFKSFHLIEQHIQAVSTKAWKKIDAAEKSAGLTQGRPRVKITAYDKLLSTALSS